MNQQTTRPTKKLAELTPGDFVFHRRWNDAEPGTVCEVKATLPYRDGDGRATVSGLLVPVAGGAPLHVRQFANILYVMATDGDLAEAHDGAVRQQLQDDLVAFQSLLGAVKPQLQMHGRDVSFWVAAGEVERIASQLALPSAQFGGTDKIAVRWTAPGDTDRGPRLTVTFWGEPEPEPTADELADEIDAAFAASDTEAEQEWLFTFGAGQQHDGRFVRITGTYDSARSRMNLVFGHAWCAQYDWQRFDEEGLPARVTELPESEWPPHAEAAQAAAEPEHHARHDGACWSSCPTCHPEAVEVRTQLAGE